MPVLVVPRAFLVTLSGSNQGTPWANVYGFSPDDPDVELTQTKVDELANDFRAFHVAINGLQHTDWILSAVTVADIRTATSPTWDGVISTLAGGATGDAMPPQSAVVMSHKSGNRGKSYNGRTYLNGFTESSNGPQGEVSSTTRASILTAFGDLKTNLATLAGTPGALAVVSRKLLEANVITSTTIDAEWDRQNRRKRR